MTLKELRDALDSMPGTHDDKTVFIATTHGTYNLAVRVIIDKDDDLVIETE